MAHKSDIGIAISIEIPVTSIVPIITGNKPNWSFIGFQVEENKISIIEWDSKIKRELNNNIIKIRKKSIEIKMVKPNINFVPIKSLIFLIFIRHTSE